jgi:tRNA(His) guanylyltransferase
MSASAQHICKTNQQIIMAYGQSDEYSIVFHKSCDLYNRRAEKILSVIVSSFTSAYVFHWNKFFDIPLQYPPCFDGRVICYPTEEILIDYFRWRQADCHVNNLYNTTFWALVKSGLSEQQAHVRLKGTTSADKNNILFEEFGINYNNEGSMYKKGTVLLRPHFEPTHCDIFKRDFYERYQIFEKKFKVV